MKVYYVSSNFNSNPHQKNHQKKKSPNFLSVWLFNYNWKLSFINHLYRSERAKALIKYFPTQTFPAVLFSTNCKHLVPLILVYLVYYYKWLENGKILLVWKRWKWGKFWCVNGGIIWNGNYCEHYGELK